MENIKPLLLGVFLGASLVYLLQECDCPVEKMKKCEESKKVTLDTTKESEIFKEENIEKHSVAKILSQPKERMKTPDELYEEQETERNYVEVEEEPLEEDRDVLPIELEQIERNSGNNPVPEIDTTIVPEALQVIENTTLEPVIVSEAESRALESDTVEFTTLPETKEVIPEALMDLEEFGDSESTPMEDDIPKWWFKDYEKFFGYHFFIKGYLKKCLGVLIIMNRVLVTFVFIWVFSFSSNAEDVYGLAIDNRAEEVVNVFEEYRVEVYSNKLLSKEPSISTKAIYWNINGKSTLSLLKVSSNYLDGDKFIVRVYDTNKLVGESSVMVLNGSSLKFNDITTKKELTEAEKTLFIILVNRSNQLNSENEETSSNYMEIPTLLIIESLQNK